MHWYGHRNVRKDLVFRKAGKLTLWPIFSSNESPLLLLAACIYDRVLIIFSLGYDVRVVIILDRFVCLQVSVSLKAHIFRLVPLLKLLLVLHDIGKVLSSAVEGGTVEIVLLFLLALVVLQDFVT